MTLDDEVAAAFARDGVACLRSVLDPGEVAAAAAAIDAVLARLGPLSQVASSAGDPGAFTEDFCRVAGDPRDRAAGPPFPGARPGRRADGHATGPLLPRSRPGEGGRDQAAHAVAPGPAVLQRRRPGRQRLDPGGPGARGRVPGAGGGLAPGSVADAAHVPEEGGPLVPRG